jgi:PIN domain nuclease of toxin-antitoxin system
VRLLLDTHIVLWLLAGSSRIPTDIYDVLADQRHTVYVSVASAWEMAINVGLGKLAIPPNLDQWLPVELAAAGMTVLPVQLDHVLGVEQLPRYHADPFDRLLIVQAQVEGLSLVSTDHVFSQYDVKLIAWQN